MGLRDVELNVAFLDLNHTISQLFSRLICLKDKYYSGTVGEWTKRLRQALHIYAVIRSHKCIHRHKTLWEYCLEFIVDNVYSQWTYHSLIDDWFDFMTIYKKNLGQNYFFNLNGEIADSRTARLLNGYKHMII